MVVVVEFFRMMTSVQCTCIEQQYLVRLTTCHYCIVAQTPPFFLLTIVNTTFQSMFRGNQCRKQVTLRHAYLKHLVIRAKGAAVMQV